MKIHTDSIGNYSIGNIRNTTEKNLDVKSADLSGEEKKYFIDRYPARKDEIVDYHFYGSSGKMEGVRLGNLIDKRG